MERPTKGCCGTCAWLAKGMTGGQSKDLPYTAVFDETEEGYREHPCHGFHFMPVGFNADKIGQLMCYRGAAKLTKEAVALGAQGIGEPDAAWLAVIWKDRKCPQWSQWTPGVGPREQFAEERSRKFTLDLKDIETRLTWLAIKVAVVIGLLQLLLMTPDSAGWKLLTRASMLLWKLQAWVFRPFGWLRYW